MSVNRTWQGLAAIAGVALLAGCGPGPAAAPDTMPTGVAQGPAYTGPKSDAGLPLPPAPAGQFPKLVALNAYRYRPSADPFALTHSERAFDIDQESERVFNQTGGFVTEYQPKPDVPVDVTPEPQPYRRLAGVVVGDSVLALIEMGNGQPAQIIHPGEKIPNSEWTVVSIDQDKAILRRGGSILPKEIEVRLELPPPGTVTTGTGTVGGPGGFPGGPGGFPGGPGGFPGGRGGPGGFPGGGKRGGAAAFGG